MTGKDTDGQTPPDSPSRRLPAHFREKSPLTDTAGTPWSGRDYATSPFPDDDGSAPPALAAAIEAHRRGDDPDRTALAAALAASRVLVPIMATATEEGTTAHGLTGDNGADMAMVSLQAPDGTAALPVFTSVAALGAWRRQARPVPVLAPQAAQAAVQEGCTSLVIDAAASAADGGPVLIQRSLLWALAQGRDWVPPHADPEVIAELDALARRSPGIIALEPRRGAQREVDLLVRLVEGLSAPQLEQVMASLGQELSRSRLIAERITSLKLTLAA